MSKKYLVYNFSGELDDILHLFPSERLARITAILQEHGQVHLIDRANLDDLVDFGSAYMQNLGELSFHETNDLYNSRLVQEAEDILSQNYDAIFLNLWHGTGFKFSIDLARYAKTKNPALKIYGIGQKIDWFKEHILSLSNNSLDALITGLGYDAVEAIACGEDVASCPNTITRKDANGRTNKREAIHVDNYPLPIYDRSVYRNIERKLPIRVITLSNQACPNQCVFCVRPENYGAVNIQRDIESVLREVRQAYVQDGIRLFRIEDSTPPKGALTRFAQAVNESDLAGQIRFTAFSRIDTNSQEDFASLRRAGCEALFFGIESLDDDNLKRLRKGITYAGIRQTLKLAHDAGIFTVGSFIVPIPGETQTSIENTLERLAEINPVLDSILALPATVYPPTKWGQAPEKYGIQLDDDYTERFVIYPIKYLIPLQQWPIPPFRYTVMGKSVDQVVRKDILTLNGYFQKQVRERTPYIPDYYYSIARHLGYPYLAFAQQITKLMFERNYAGIGKVLSEARPPLDVSTSLKEPAASAG